MISIIRKGFGKKAYSVIIWITIISVAGLSSFVGIFKKFSGVSSTAVATVNGYEISLNEFRRQVAEEDRRIKYLKQQFGDYAMMLMQSMGMSGKPDEMALQDLVQEKLLLDVAHTLNIHLSADYISQKFEDPAFAMRTLGDLMPPYVFDSMGGINQQALMKHLQRQGISITDFEQMLENILKRTAVMTLVSGAFGIPNCALKERFMRDYMSKKFMVIPLSVDTYNKNAQKSPVTDAELTTFFAAQNAAHKRYWTPEKRNGTVWTFTPQDFGISVTEKEPDKFKKLFTREAQRVLSESTENPAVFDKFVLSKHARRSPLSQVAKNPSAVGKKLFELTQGKRVAFIDNGQGVILELLEIKPSYAPSFDAVKDRVKADFYKERALEKLANDMAEAQNALKSGTSITEVAQRFGVKPEAINGLTGRTAEAWEPLKKREFPVQRMMNMINPGAVIDQITPTQGYVIQLAAVGKFDQVLFETHKKEIMKALYQETGQQFASGFVASLHKNATIKVNQSAFSAR